MTISRYNGVDFPFPLRGTWQRFRRASNSKARRAETPRFEAGQCQTRGLWVFSMFRGDVNLRSRTRAEAVGCTWSPKVARAGAAIFARRDLTEKAKVGRVVSLHTTKIACAVSLQSSLPSCNLRRNRTTVQPSADVMAGCANVWSPIGENGARWVKHPVQQVGRSGAE
jgi:hypothetical protein